ncbi:flagellar basal body L-ring protein FlgH [Neotabrizicola shimadae]|uniref:Flagellar L-ring protein n=1 Tax=Neotabrizicola shimadae TaxID=2807096 RepID=A0A8G0ZWF9_9RHOB|nr:flagellar basal body L-ring protein FlgH [Neotabrizicola shimadae]QYZ69945.1 flagellar basal body L-ring protein FlgH [Neotabrizicola shimadae]
MTRAILLVLLATAACARFDHFGGPPSFSEVERGSQSAAMYTVPVSDTLLDTGPGAESSLWTDGPDSLYADPRAARAGDILTVVIAIDDEAEISNRTDQSREGSEELDIPAFFGLPQRAAAILPDGATLDPAVEISSNSDYQGDGSVRRNEKLTLRIAATVVERLPNGALRIEGQQEVRVNNELRELTVTGFVRSSDISRKNEITYDKIAGARISYGGRGQISDVQMPRYGQQVTDAILPY